MSKFEKLTPAQQLAVLELESLFGFAYAGQAAETTLNRNLAA